MTEKTITTVKLRPTSTPVAVKDLEKWLRECLYLSVEEGEEGTTPRLTRIVARQLVKGNKRGEEVFHADVPRKAGESWPESASMELYGRLQSEAANLGGLQKYALYAYHSGDDEHHTSRHVIRIQGVDEDEEESGLESESPDKTGLTSQAMRHAEAYARQMTGMVMTLASTFSSTLNRQSAMIEKLLAEKADSLDTMQVLLDDREAREVKMIQARAKARGTEDLISKLGLLLPAAVNRITGKPVFPVSDTSVMMMTRGLLTSLVSDPERLKQIMPMLSMEETLAFNNLLETVSAKFDENGMPAKQTEKENEK